MVICLFAHYMSRNSLSPEYMDGISNIRLERRLIGTIQPDTLVPHREISLLNSTNNCVKYLTGCFFLTECQAEQVTYLRSSIISPVAACLFAELIACKSIEWHFIKVSLLWTESLIMLCRRCRRILSNLYPWFFPRCFHCRFIPFCSVYTKSLYRVELCNCGVCAV